MTISVGKAMESVAKSFLTKQGARLLHQNFRTRLGEIDLIVQHGDYTVFVEVKYRTHKNFGGPLASVTFKKQRKLIRAAQCYLQRYPNLVHAPCRFDVIAIHNSTANTIEWIQNAFQVV